jgi:hypothetical protein
LVKGALVSFNLPNLVPQIILFQYNPETLTRTLYPRGRDESEGAKSENSRLNGTPSETINLDIELDATDQLEHPDENKSATMMGIGPQLASLEMMLYPRLSDIGIAAALSALGAIQISPLDSPFILFVWGAKRVLPVSLTDLKISEEAHDTKLNPTRAKVSLGLQVLSYTDFSRKHPGYYVFMAHHATKEVMSIVGSVNSISAIGSEEVKLFGVL